MEPVIQARAFAVQYTAVILIVLTFFIGNLSEPSAASYSYVDNSRELMPASPPVATLRNIRLFRGQSSHINKEALRMLVTVVQSHDVQLSFKISSQKHIRRLSLERARKLYQALKARDVNERDFSISTIDGGLRQVTVQVIRSDQS